MTSLTEILIAALLVIAGSFGLVGSLGLLRLRQPMQRLHGPTKATTLGVGAALTASVIELWLTRAELTWQEILVTAFLFLTAPIIALCLAKVQMRQSVPRSELPPTGTARDWASFDKTRPPPA